MTKAQVRLGRVEAPLSQTTEPGAADSRKGRRARGAPEPEHRGMDRDEGGEGLPGPACRRENGGSGKSFFKPFSGLISPRLYTLPPGK